MDERNWARRAQYELLLLPLALIWLTFPVSMALAQEPTSEDCLDCHDDLGQFLQGTPHQIGSGPAGLESGIQCTDCHSGGEVHIEDPSPENISNPGMMTGLDAVNACSECHSAHQSLDDYGFDTHSNQELACGNCHTVHGGKHRLLLDDSAEFCQKCHTETKARFARRSSHPVSTGPMTCLSCHRFTNRVGDNLSYDLGGVCQGCHPNQGGPFLYEHEGVNAYSAEGGGCVECHEPHGSQNDHLLKQPGNQLCKQCHADHITRNHDRLWDSAYSKLACQSCHTDLHGSMISRHLLAPDMPTKLGGGDCYQSGCHSLTGQ